MENKNRPFEVGEVVRWTPENLRIVQSEDGRRRWNGGPFTVVGTRGCEISGERDIHISPAGLKGDSSISFYYANGFVLDPFLTAANKIIKNAEK